MASQTTRRNFIKCAAAVGAAAAVCPSVTMASEQERTAKNSTVFASVTTGVGELKVEVEFENGAIVSVVVDAHEETPSIGGAAAELMASRILEAQSVDVDTVAGATLTCNAIRQAVANCIAQATEGADPFVDDHLTPIAPAGVPDVWDYEADAVVVGTGTGGMAAATKLATGGKRIIVLEREAQLGGTSRMSKMISVYGGTKLIEDDFGVFGTPYRDQDVFDHFQDRSRWVCNPDYLGVLVLSVREFLDFLADIGANVASYGGTWYYPTPIEGEGPTARTHQLLKFMRGICEQNGAQFLMSTPATSLIMDGGRCVGVQAFDEHGKTVNVKANEAVVLAASGFARNPKMLAAYGNLTGRVKAGFTKGTGEVIRMAQGCGAGMQGLGTLSLAGLTAMPDAQQTMAMINLSPYFDYLTCAAHLPWLLIDPHGNRVEWPTNAKTVGTDSSSGYSKLAVQMLARGGEGYVIFDSAWKENMACFDDTDTGGLAGMNQGVVKEYHTEGQQTIPDEWICDDPDESVRRNLETGALKTANTIADLAQAAGLDATEIQAAVDNWNALCAAGADDPVHNYDPAWLVPIQNPPYYIFHVGVSMWCSRAGVSVNPKNEVTDTDGHPIPGLYAAEPTAGSTESQGFYDGFGGGISSMYASGYNAALSILGEGHTNWIA